MEPDHDEAKQDIPPILFISTTRFNFPLTTQQRKKWSAMSDRMDIYLLGFSENGWQQRQAEGCHFLTLPSSLPLFLRVCLYFSVVPLAIFYYTIRWNCSIWVAQSPYEAGTAVVPKLLMSPFLSTTLIVEAHGDWIKSFFELRNPPFPNILRKVIEGYSYFILTVADAYRSISTETEQLLLEYGNSSHPHLQFPTYTNIETFLDVTLDDKSETERHMILYAGAITELKGIGNLIEAFEAVRDEFPDLRLELCGDGRKRDYFENLCREKNLQDNVNFAGHLDQKKLKERMLQAKLLVLPSRTEGLGRVLIEGLACFTPFVATSCGGPEEIASSSNGGVTVPIGDPEALAQAIRSLLPDPDRRRVMGTSGHQYVKSHYSSASYVGSYRKLFRKVVDNFNRE